MALLEAIGIGKTYPGGVVANDGVGLVIEPGEVHAVVGENGAGKSTLMKILFGIEQPNSGTLLLDGKQVHFANPREAIDAGIGMVFQHFSLVPSFSVYENVVLGSEPKAGIRLDRQKAIAEVQALSDKFRLKVDPLPPVGSLPVGQQQRVEILKALYRNARILILDEPTAVLAPQEVQELFLAIRSLVAQGKTVIFIAHKLPEVLEISNTITVMRQGKTVGQVKTTDVTEKGLAAMMVGREVSLRVDRKPTDQSERVASVSGLRVVNARGTEVVAGLDLNVHSGEIVGLVGVEGNGQAETLEAIAGLRHIAAGDITIANQNAAPLSVLERRGLGLASIPEDRIAEGLATGSTVAENLVATRLNDARYVRNGLLDLKAIKANATKLIEQFSIRVGGPGYAVGTLSGGNMQKVVVARELAEHPKLLLVNQPTRGVDLGATQFIWRTITDARDNGAAVLLSSADLSELLALSDRLIVLYRGKIVAAFLNTPDLTPETLGTYMLGLSTQTADEMKAALKMSNIPAIDRASRWITIRREVGRAVGALVIALVVTFVIVLITSKAPLDAITQLLTAPASKPRTIGLWLDDVAKLTVTGLAFSLVFQARQFAMGVQGQVYIGALAASYVALSPLGASWAGIPLGIAAAMLAGAIYGFLPGIAKARLGANEIVSSLMLNYIAIELCNFLVRTSLPKPQPGVLTTNDFPDSAVFPQLIKLDGLNITRLDLGLVFAILAVLVVWFALYRTSWGLKLRLVGHNARFAEYSGIKSTFIMVSAMTAAGALGGLLGSMFVQGQGYGKLTVLFEGGLAFEGILVAIVARSRPLAVPVVALFYGYLRQGAQLMNIRTDVPAEVIGVVTAIIILLVSSSFSLNFVTRLFRRGPSPAAAPAVAGGAAK